jgi:hypothetical protein
VALPRSRLRQRHGLVQVRLRLGACGPFAREIESRPNILRPGVLRTVPGVRVRLVPGALSPPPFVGG